MTETALYPITEVQGLYRTIAELRQHIADLEAAQTLGAADRVILRAMEGREMTRAQIDVQAAEIERMRGALLWTLWHRQGGSSPIGQPIRRALGMGQFDQMTPEQIECGQRFGVSA